MSRPNARAACRAAALDDFDDVFATLREREREVLRHLSGLLSTAEVASEMYITVNTVKTHLTHIYRKLATTRRGEAVRRARQLKLI